MLRTFLVLLFTCSSVFGSSGYTRAMFRTTMTKDNLAVSGSVSVSPLYVLIKLRDPKTDEDRDVCTLGINLQGAIEEEYHLDMLKDGRKIFDIAMSAPNRVFQFKSRKARENVAAIYTPAQLAEVRRLLHGKSHAQLRKEAKVDLSKEPDQQSVVTRLYRQPKGSRLSVSDQYRVAVAHVLLEHGVFVGELHDAGALYVYH